MKAVTKIFFFDEEGNKFFGDGPCRLLLGIKENGSLHATASAMGMAYTKAVRLIKTAEKSLGFPLTVRSIGGKTGGGSVLTPEGEEWLAKYLAYKEACVKENQKLYDRYFAEENFHVEDFGIKESEIKEVLTSEVGLVIMASGLGKRFGGNKLMAKLGEKPMVQWILDTTDFWGENRVVVTRNQMVKELCEQRNIKVIFHDLPGRNDTIRLGVKSFENRVKGCMFCPSDQPFLRKETLIQLLQKINNEPEVIWRTSYKQEVGAPVYFPQKYFSELSVLPSGEGGKSIIHSHMDELGLLEVEDSDELRDIDTKEDYEWAMSKIKNK